MKQCRPARSLAKTGYAGLRCKKLKSGKQTAKRKHRTDFFMSNFFPKSFQRGSFKRDCNIPESPFYNLIPDG
jgi:hypothetical protein